MGVRPYKSNLEENDLGQAERSKQDMANAFNKMQVNKRMSSMLSEGKPKELGQQLSKSLAATMNTRQQDNLKNKK
jgi:hypothetical protein